MVAWLELQDKRQRLDCKRHCPISLFEVLSDQLTDDQPHDLDDVLQKDAYNNGNEYWGLYCRNIFIAFAWVTYEFNDARWIVGGTCVYRKMAEAPEKRARLGTTSLYPADIKEAGNYLCKYVGCHHVLWKNRLEFVNSFLWLILDNPELRDALQLLDHDMPVFYFLPQHIGNVENEQAIKCVPVLNRCRNSRYLKEAEEEHMNSVLCGEEVEENFKECMAELKFQVITNAMDRDLKRQATGVESLESIGLCTIL